ncbi:SRPBCC family protein [Variovorax humicola]|uniref:SRPBCC family protein n=1 Tax=Variovorax humicola TaxID=1769758 RepID=A0ABU8W3W6_9BURK
MKVTLEKTFAMPGSADAAWAVLQDIDAVAGCMPGARITERIDATHFKGTVGVKFGPASMSFRGEVEIVSMDAAGRTLRLVGKGTDTTGGSGAAMDLTARVEAVDATACNLVGTSEVSMSGKAAAFGGRMMDSVADQVLKQFAGNFAAKVQAVQALGAAATPVPDAPVGEAAAAAAASSALASSAAASSASAPAAPPAVAPPPAEAPQLNAFALAWAIFKDWLRSLFGARRA